MGMKTALEIINRMQADGVIGPYTIGGATGAMFYIEAITTIDVDIFTSFKSASTLDPLRELLNYLAPKGYTPEGEHFNIDGTKIQFLPVLGDLSREAVDQAVEMKFKGVIAFVMTPEHLMAIALDLGRPKDFDRIERFLDADKFDEDDLRVILKRHNLTTRWESFMLQRRRK